MRYSDEDRQSENVEDRRGQSPGGMFGRGGGSPIRIPLGGGGMGIGTLVIIGIICLLLGINPLTLLTGEGIQIPNMPRPDASQNSRRDIPGMPRQGQVGSGNDEMRKFVGQVLADTEDVWERVFKGAGRTYEKPRLVDLRGRHAHPGLWSRPGTHGALLLPARPQRVHRFGFLRRFEAPLRRAR